METVPEKDGNSLNDDFFATARNRLTDLVPDPDKWIEGVRVVDDADTGGGVTVKLNANTLDQKVVCYIDRRDD